MIRVLIVDDDPARVPRITKHAQLIAGARTLHVMHQACVPRDLSGYDLVYLDHDLGEETTYEQLKRAPAGALRGKHVIIHSMNPVGARNLQAAIEDAASVTIVPLSSMAP